MYILHHAISFTDLFLKIKVKDSFILIDMMRNSGVVAQLR